MLGPLSGRRGFRVGPVLGRRVEVVAQAQPNSRAGPARGTDPSVPDRSRAVLFRTVLGPAHCAWPMWPSILEHVGRVTEDARGPPCLLQAPAEQAERELERGGEREGWRG
jgi:hypothetical protein